MNILMFLAALAVITLGHFFRIRRWKSFISRSMKIHMIQT